MAKSRRYRKKTIHSRKARRSKKTIHSRKTRPKRSSRRSAGMYSMANTKVSKNIVLNDLKKVFPYDQNIKSLFPKQEDYDEFITDVAQANAMLYTYSDYNKHGENKMITMTKEDLKTLTQEYKKKVMEALLEKKGKLIEKIPEEVLNKIVSNL